MDDKLNTCICGLTACDKDNCLNKTMTDVPESVGAFIMAQPGLNPLVTANGYYWHYKDIITLMTRYREQTGTRWVKCSDKLPETHKVRFKDVNGHEFNGNYSRQTGLFYAYRFQEPIQQVTEWLDELNKLP